MGNITLKIWAVFNEKTHQPTTKITFIDAFLDQKLFGWPTMEELLEAIPNLGLTLLRTCS
jgi:hypothetical protein